MLPWPDTQCPTLGEFGLQWRSQFSSNDEIDYRFEQQGTGIGGSDADKEIRWFFNKDFRLARLKDMGNDLSERVIDFTRYDRPAKEPQELTRHWSLMGDVNQKQTRPQDKPVPFNDLPADSRAIILKRYPDLNTNH